MSSVCFLVKYRRTGTRCVSHHLSFCHTRAPSWILSYAENLASSSLQDGAMKWLYCAVGTTHPNTVLFGNQKVKLFLSMLCGVPTPIATHHQQSMCSVRPNWYLTPVEVWICKFFKLKSDFYLQTVIMIVAQLVSPSVALPAELVSNKFNARPRWVGTKPGGELIFGKMRD